MEPRTATGDWDEAHGRDTVDPGLGRGSWRLRAEIAVCSASPRARCAWWRTTWAAATGRAIARTPSTRWWRGPPVASAVRSNGRARAWRTSSYGLSESRPRVVRRAGARRRGNIPGLPRRECQQHRRARHLVHPARQGDWRLDQRVSRAGSGDARPGDAEPHDADHAVSSRRPARGNVRHRAHDRPRGPATWLRSPGAAPAQSRPGGGDAVPQSAGFALRQRRLRGRAGPRRGAGGLGRL